MILAAAIALLCLTAVADWIAVRRGWKRMEYFAKPATMVLLLGILALEGDLHAVPVICFGLGILFSLLGDVFLMFSFYRFSNRWFIPGLLAFLLAHVAYIVGFNTPLPQVSPLWSLGMALVLAIGAARVLRRIVAGIRQKGLPRMTRPVVIYGMVITVMLLSALLTLYRRDWTTAAAGLVSLGAILFFFSDVVLAWNKFVTPIKNGRLLNMILYHLGQFALVAGVILQFKGA